MEIPNKVKIGGIEYTVKKTTRPCKNDMNVDGEIIYDMGTIELREGSGECRDYRDMVFIHEVMHGIFHHMCIEQDEELIKKISMGLHQVIKDNSNIFKEKCIGSYDPYIVKHESKIDMEISVGENEEESYMKISKKTYKALSSENTHLKENIKKCVNIINKLECENSQLRKFSFTKESQKLVDEPLEHMNVNVEYDGGTIEDITKQFAERLTKALAVIKS